MKNTKESISTLSGRIDAVQKEQDFNKEASRFWIRLLSAGVIILFIGFYCLYYASQKKTAQQFIPCIICKHAVTKDAITALPVVNNREEKFTANFCSQHAPKCDRITTPMWGEQYALSEQSFWKYERANAPFVRVNADGSELDPPKPRVEYVTNECKKLHWIDLIRNVSNTYITNTISTNATNWTFSRQPHERTPK